MSSIFLRTLVFAFNILHSSGKTINARTLERSRGLLHGHHTAKHRKLIRSATPLVPTIASSASDDFRDNRSSDDFRHDDWRAVVADSDSLNHRLEVESRRLNQIREIRREDLDLTSQASRGIAFADLSIRQVASRAIDTLAGRVGKRRQNETSRTSILTPCASRADWVPEARLSATESCQDYMLSAQDFTDSIQKAYKAGSCENIRLQNGASLDQHVMFVASQCCRGAKTVCDPDATLVTPCERTLDFEWDKSFQFSCQLPATPPIDRTKCVGAGCMWKVAGSGGLCECSDKSSCDKLGGRGEDLSCSDLLVYSYDLHQRLRQAELQGTCEELITEDGTPLSEQVQGIAFACCLNYPKNLCHKHVEAVSPCAAESEFMKTSTFTESCTFLRPPLKVECENNGCFWTSSENSCICQTADTCAKLGGTFSSITCEDYGKMMAPEFASPVAEAKTKASCDGLTTADGADLNARMKGWSMLCCSNFPVNVCEPNAQVFYPCDSPVSFNKENIVSVDCSIPYTATEQECADAGCSHLNDGDCFCETEGSCRNLGGTFHELSCGLVAKISRAISIGLKKANDTGTCDNIEHTGTNFGEADVEFQAHVELFAEKCCDTYPKHACSKEGVLQTAKQQEQVEKVSKSPERESVVLNGATNSTTNSTTPNDGSAGAQQHKHGKKGGTPWLPVLLVMILIVGGVASGALWYREKQKKGLIDEEAMEEQMPDEVPEEAQDAEEEATEMPAEGEDGEGAEQALVGEEGAGESAEEGVEEGATAAPALGGFFG